MLNVFLISVISVLPSDRLSMADRLFAKGLYEDAAAEYRTLVGQEGVKADEIRFRLAECDRAAGRNDAAHTGYREVFAKHPDSRFASQARFLYAMGAPKEERRKMFA